MSEIEKQMCHLLNLSAASNVKCHLKVERHGSWNRKNVWQWQGWIVSTGHYRAVSDSLASAIETVITELTKDAIRYRENLDRALSGQPWPHGDKEGT